MKGKDPRDAAAGVAVGSWKMDQPRDLHPTYTQNMAFGVRPPNIAEWIVNLGEAAEYMADHNIFQDRFGRVVFLRDK